MKFHDIRLKLQRKFAPLISCDYDELNSELRRFENFLSSTEVLSTIVEELKSAFPTLDEQLQSGLANNKVLDGETHSENALIGYLIMKRTLADVGARRSNGLEFSRYVRMRSQMDMSLSDYKDRYLRPLFDELDERLQDEDHVLAEILHVKQAIEWFEREAFSNIYAQDTRRGEKNLAWRFYGMLHSRGIQFSIEPTSVSGAADMVLAQDSEHPLIADIKIFEPISGKNSTYIKQGFRQVYRYLEDYNQSVGYLIVFALSEKALRIADLQSSTQTPSVSIHGRTIFLIQIDLFNHELSASHRRESLETLSQAELIETATANEPT